MAEPMSDERLAVIRTHADRCRESGDFTLGDYHARDLLAEVERLRAELTRDRESLAHISHEAADLEGFAVDIGVKLKQAEAERDQARADVKALAIEVDRLSDAAAVSANAARTLRSRVEAARATAAELHDPTSPDGDCVELCIGCRLERDLDGETGGRS